MSAKIHEIIDAPISELEPAKPICVEPTLSIGDTIKTMQKHKIGCVLVSDGDELLGIFSERDLLMRFYDSDKKGEMPISEFMTVNPECLEPHHPLAYALNRMSMGGYRHIPILDHHGHPAGIISVKDIVNHLVAHVPEAVYNLPPEPGMHSASREGA